MYKCAFEDHLFIYLTGALKVARTFTTVECLVFDKQRRKYRLSTDIQIDFRLTFQSAIFNVHRPNEADSCENSPRSSSQAPDKTLRVNAPAYYQSVTLDVAQIANGTCRIPQASCFSPQWSQHGPCACTPKISRQHNLADLPFI